MKPLTFFYNSAAKLSSVAIGLLTLGIIVGATACNREQVATVQNGSEIATSPIPLEVEPSQSEEPAPSTLPDANSIPSPDSVSNQPDASNIQPDAQTQEIKPPIELQEEGQLQLVNDTPYMSIVYIYDSAEESYRYAYVAPCTTRELYDTYSGSRLMSLNSHAKVPIAQKAMREGDFFVVKLSTLVDDGQQGQLCEFDSAEALEIVNPAEFWKVFSSGAKKVIGQSIDDIPWENYFSRAGDVSLEKATSTSKQFSNLTLAKLDSVRQNPETVIKVSEFGDKGQERIWAHYLAPQSNQDPRSRNLLSAVRIKIEQGQINSEDALKTFIQKLKKDCSDLFTAAILVKFEKAAPYIYKAFQAGIPPKDVNLGSSGQFVTMTSNTPKNEQFIADLSQRPDCALTRTRTNDPVLVPISDRSRPQVQGVLQ